MGRPFLIQSVMWRTKSKKKSPSGTEMTLSITLTKRLNPSDDFIFSLCEIAWHRSDARVEDFTTKAWKREQVIEWRNAFKPWTMAWRLQNCMYFIISSSLLPRLSRRGSKFCGIFALFCVGLLQLLHDEEEISSVPVLQFSGSSWDNPRRWDDVWCGGSGTTPSSSSGCSWRGQWPATAAPSLAHHCL